MVEDENLDCDEYPPGGDKSLQSTFFLHSFDRNLMVGKQNFKTMDIFIDITGISMLSKFGIFILSKLLNLPSLLCLLFLLFHSKSAFNFYDPSFLHV